MFPAGFFLFWCGSNYMYNMQHTGRGQSYNCRKNPAGLSMGRGNNFSGVWSQFFCTLMMRKFGTHPLSKKMPALWSLVGAKYPLFIHQHVIFVSKFSSVTWLHTIGNFYIADWQTKRKIKGKLTFDKIPAFSDHMFYFYVSYHSLFIKPTKQR